jgi:ElaB/YqjD/DUF883 family membrane-anchored ribosome-binding protein
MYTEIKVLDKDTLKPIEGTTIYFYDENGNYFKPWGLTDSKGIASVEDERAKRGNTIGVMAPGYRGTNFQLKNLDYFDNGQWIEINKGVIYLQNAKSYGDAVKKFQTERDLKSGLITLEEIKLSEEKKRIADEAQAELNKLTGIVNGVFQGSSFSLKARLASLLSSVQKLTQSPYSNVREGATQLLNEAQDLQLRIDAIEKDLNQIIKDFDAYVADLKAKQLASLK